jgi:glutathione-specific gamma-glutamylcyclotransferase
MQLDPNADRLSVIPHGNERQPLGAPAPSTFRYLSDEERQASLQHTLRHWCGEKDLWVYAYGSLIWNPEFDFQEKRLSRLRGHHRSLCLWSRVNRGTPECPGLVFGLDRGGSCRGMSFRIKAQEVQNTFEALWRREMATGAYHPRWLRCDTTTGPVTALAFVMDRSSSGYVKALSEGDMVEIVWQASGRYGPCMDYVVQTHDALVAAGIEDRRLARLTARLRERLKQDDMA